MSIFMLLLWLLTALNIFRVVILKKAASEMVGWFLLQLFAGFLQIQNDHFSWQLILIYFMPLTYVIFYKVQKNFGKVLLVASFVLTCLLIISFPKPELDKPKGPYIVGTDTVYIFDETRDRELPTQFWYPSESSGKASPELWLTDELIDGFEEHFNLPSFLMNQIRTVKTHSYPKIEMADGEFPVIVMSHGWASFRKIHLNIAEHLASYGYVVIIIDHPNASVMTKLYDGNMVLCNRDLLKDESIQADGKALIDTFTLDVETVIERLPDINKYSLFRNHFDLDHIGVMGHSTGAAAMIQYANEHHVGALIGLDPWVEPLTNIKPLETNQVYFRSDDWSEGPNNENLSILTDQVYQVKNSSHQDFTMAYVFSPVLKWIGYTSGRGKEVQESVVLDFFDGQLKNKEVTMDEKYLIKMNQ